MTLTSSDITEKEAEALVQRRFALMLYRSLQRLHIAIKECARIGFEESSPTRNAHHASVWLALSEAQADAALKLKAYEDWRRGKQDQHDP